jgi:hypothetical protein
VNPPLPDDPLDYVDLDDILQHGAPSDWMYVGPKEGSPVPAHSIRAHPGTMKHYDIYRDADGEEIELHYFRHPDGSVGNVKVMPRS